MPICFTFTCNRIDHTGLSLVVFGLGLITAFWSRSRSRSCTVWCRSWSWSYYMFWSH